MYKVIFFAAILFSTSSLNAQCDCFDQEKKFLAGFSMGGNYATFYDLSPNVNLVPQPGFGLKLGVFVDLKMSKLISINPRAELAFNNSSISIPDQGGTPALYEVMPITLEFSPLLKVRTRNEKLVPYFVAGPNFKFSIENSSFSNVFPSGNDIAIDVGFGIEKGLHHFITGMEFRYSLGLRNVNLNPTIERVKVHNVSFVLNFMG